MARLTNPKDRALADLNEGADNPDEEPVSRVTVVTKEAAVQQAPVAQINVTDLAQAFAQALGASQAQHATDMEALIKNARSRRPESFRGDFPFPNISAFNPDGDAKPCPPLKCEMWEGIWVSTENRARKGYPLEQGDLGPLTKREVRLLNQLTPGVFTIENRDGGTGTLRIVGEHDPSGALTLLILAYPETWLSKEEKHVKPSVTETCKQIFGIEGNVDQWLDAKDAEAVAA